MPVLDHYLFFREGRCAEAMRFYEATLGGRIEGLMTYADGPDPQQGGAEAAKLVMHCSMKLGDRTLMASDFPPGQGDAPAMGGFALSLSYESAAEARRIFDLLAAGGRVVMPMGPTFWAEAFGMLADRYGTPWMVGGGRQAA